MTSPARRQELADLMARLADGDRAAFAPLYGALWPLVRDFCRRALTHDADGDDAAQQALVNLFARAPEYDEGRDAVAWALGIAAWECRTVRRRRLRRREEELPEEEPPGDGAAAPDEEALRRELLQAAGDLLGTLRADDVATIAAAIDGDPDGRAGIAPATFRKRLERALGRLRAAWRSKHGTL
jgi:DNA-directed RNA polymerase specialized sigma24 family protein